MAELQSTLIMSPQKRELVWGAELDARFTVPMPGRFSREIIDAPELQSIAAKIIGRHFGPALASTEIDYLWKKKGGTKAGVPILGACVKVSGIWQAFTEAQWVIWVAADNCQFLTNWQMQCNMIHQLLHAGVGEKGEPTTIGHDFEVFAKEFQLCGCWTEGLRVAGLAINQLQLPFQTAMPLDQTEPLEADTLVGVR